MNILAETAAALPEVTERLRDFLAPRSARPSGEAASAAPEAEAAEAGPGCGCGEQVGPCTQKPCVEGCDGWLHTGSGRHGCEGGRGFAQPASPLVPAEPSEPSADDSTPDETGDAPHEPAPTAEADASALAEHPLDGAQ